MTEYKTYPKVDAFELISLFLTKKNTIDDMTLVFTFKGQNGKPLSPEYVKGWYKKEKKRRKK